MDVDVRTVDTVGEWNPKFLASTPHKGQANFVLLRLKDKEVRACYCQGEVGIYSRHKLPILVDAVKESYNYVDKAPAQIDSDCLKIQKGQELICVLLNKGATAYVTEEKMPKLQYYIFMREVPTPHEYRIFATKRDMVKELEEKENYLI